MSVKLLIVFIILNIANVVIQTVKSIATIKCGKWGASIVNALAYGLYTYVIIYTVCELPIHLKALIVAAANLIGVYVVKYFEEKSRKDKMWKVEVAVLNRWANSVHFDLKDVPHNYNELGQYTVFNFYCNTPKDTQKVKDIVMQYPDTKISAYESKLV